MIEQTAWLDYRVSWRSGDVRPGRHPARQAGNGGALLGYRSFWQLPDVRRIDVRRSMINPAGEIIVKQMQSRSSINVAVIADLSRSMRPRLATGKIGCIATLVRALSRSAHRAGDSFAFIGVDRTIRRDLLVPLSRLRGPALDIAERLSNFEPNGSAATALPLAAAELPERRCLVLLVSDFLMPLPLVRDTLTALARHDVVPIVLHDADEANIPQPGLVRLRDVETGRSRLLLMRPKLRARLESQARSWREELDHLFLNACRPAFHVAGTLNIPALGQHLLHA